MSDRVGEVARALRRAAQAGTLPVDPDRIYTLQPAGDVLDVEWLAQALEGAGIIKWAGGTQHAAYTTVAAAIAAEYDRLSAGVSTVEIRATHQAWFRSGQWAVITGVEWANDHPCYQVRFPDGVTDSWVVSDPSDPYEFRPA